MSGKGYQGMLGFPGGRVITLFWYWRPQVSFKCCCHREPQAIWCNVWLQTIIRLHFFCLFYCLFICCRKMMSLLILKVDRCHRSFYTLREKCPIPRYFWFVFSCIRSKYGDLWGKSLYLVRIQENANQK